MQNVIETRLSELGIQLKEAPVAVGAYVPCVVEGSLLYISGQIPIDDGQIKFTGQMSTDTHSSSNDISVGQASARLCCINILTQAKATLGSLDRIERCIRLGGFVSCPPDFYDHAQVVNGASDLMKEIFGENGQHCRAAVGCSSLPLNSLTEVEALFKIRA